jgi:hypothetical protein
LAEGCDVCQAWARRRSSAPWRRCSWRLFFSLTDASGSLLRIQGNPAQIRITSELTFGTGFVYATFTLTNACELPQDAVGLFAAEGMVDRTFPATIASCPGATAPMALSASTRTNPNEH